MSRCQHVFLDPLVDPSAKNMFRLSLHDSRLNFNCHVRVRASNELSVLNHEYMRIIRRVEDMMQFDKSAVSDVAVRRSANYPSIDCVHLRARLR